MKKFKATLRGQTLVEFALVLPILIFIIMMLVDLGRGVYYYSVIYNAAREGARYGIIVNNDTVDTDGIEAAARKLAIALDQNSLTVSTSQVDDPTTQKPLTITVTVQYRFYLVTPLVGNFIGANPFILTSRSTMNTEE